MAKCSFCKLENSVREYERHVSLTSAQSVARLASVVQAAAPETLCEKHRTPDPDLLESLHRRVQLRSQSYMEGLTKAAEQKIEADCRAENEKASKKRRPRREVAA